MTVDVLDLAIPGVKLITPARFGDERGFFSETYNRRALAQAGIDAVFVQDNHAFSRSRGTVRGFHFQRPPDAQGKLIRVSRGSIFDVVIDLRRGGASYGRHLAVELGAANWHQLWVPPGFAHGYCTLEPDTEVVYKTTSYYAPKSEGGILWNDPGLGIDWPDFAGAEVSARDARLPPMADVVSPF